MTFFKSKEEKRIERDMKIRAGLKQIEKSIAQQEKFQQDFVRTAQEARRIGDNGQYQFIRNNLKKTAGVKRMLERQLLSMKSAMLIQQQAAACGTFAKSMNLMAQAIGASFAQTDLTATQAAWEKATAQAANVEERMGLFLEGMEDKAADGSSTNEGVTVSESEIDAMIDADLLAREKGELADLESMEKQIEGRFAAKQRV